jgi:hypothetical protein
LTAPATLAPRRPWALADAAVAAGLTFLLARPALGAASAAVPLLAAGYLATTAAALAAAAPSPPFAASVSAVRLADLGRSYRAGCPVGPAQLRLLRLSYRGFDGHTHVGTLVVNRRVSRAVSEACVSLTDALALRRVVSVS